MQSPKQEQALDIITKTDKLTVTQIAKKMGIAVKAAGAHLRRLEQSGRIHVSEWRKNEYNVMTKCYTAGYGVSVVHIGKERSKTFRQKADNKPKKEKIEELELYVAPNIGWVSHIHAQDSRMNHSEHIRFMSQFKPHPDVAAQWLFK